MNQLPSKTEAFRLIKELSKDVGRQLFHSPKYVALDAKREELRRRFEESPAFVRVHSACEAQWRRDRAGTDRVYRALRNVRNEIMAIGINTVTCRKLLAIHRHVHGVVETKNCVTHSED